MWRQCKTLEEATVLEMFYFTGLRLREGMGLKVRHIDLGQRRIFVLKGKGDKDRIVVFNQRVADLLREFIGSRGLDDWLFASPRYQGKRRSLEWLHQVFERIRHDAGLPYPLTAHILRHGFTRLCKVRGVPVDMAAKQLGHNNILTTSRQYGRVDVNDLQDVYDRLNPER